MLKPQSITASLNLHGMVSTVLTDVIVTKISASEFLVQSASPILLKAVDHGLDVGIEALRTVAQSKRYRHDRARKLHSCLHNTLMAIGRATMKKNFILSLCPLKRPTARQWANL